MQTTSLKGVLVLEADAVKELAMVLLELLLILSERLEGRDEIEQIVVLNSFVKLCLLINSSISAQMIQREV